MTTMISDARAPATRTEPPREANRTIAPLPCSAVLTHHWLVRMRGGEKVLAALAELLPEAPVYTLVHDRDGIDGPWPRVHASWLQRIPGAARRYPALFPLMPAAARSMRLPDADLVLCSDAALAKAMRPHARSVVVCYCHSPMRYVWEPDVQRDYLRTLAPPLRPAFRAACAYARRVDRRAAERVDHFIANSRHVAERIRRCYGREATVIYPPVDVPGPAEPRAGERVAGSPLPDGRGSDRRADFYLCVGHHTAYKRLDLAVEACQALGRRLVVIGDGPEVRRLRRRPQCGAVTWLGWQPDPVVHDHYRRARGLLFCGEEDFGLVPVEAQAHGCPVVAYAVGGTGETVLAGRTGVLFREQTTGAVLEALRELERSEFDRLVLHENARRFSRARFLREMRDFLEHCLA